MPDNRARGSLEMISGRQFVVCWFGRNGSLGCQLGGIRGQNVAAAGKKGLVQFGCISITTGDHFILLVLK